MKKVMLGLIVGIVVATTTTVLAASLVASSVTYTPSNSAWKVSNVEAALNDLFSKSKIALNKVCELKSGNALEIGSMYECDPGDGVKRNFYVLKVGVNSVKLIMQHNITEGSSKTTMTWMDAMKYIDSNSLKTSWKNVVDVDLPIAQDIADAVGNSAWKMEDKNYNGWFYLDSKSQTQVANASNISSYAWLYNYTRECTSCGCVASTSLGSTEAYGYWTRDIVAQQLDTTGRAWDVVRGGRLTSGTVSDAAYRGVRPVITILKSNLS